MYCYFFPRCLSFPLLNYASRLISFLLCVCVCSVNESSCTGITVRGKENKRGPTDTKTKQNKNCSISCYTLYLFNVLFKTNPSSFPFPVMLASLSEFYRAGSHGLPSRLILNQNFPKATTNWINELSTRYLTFHFMCVKQSGDIDPNFVAFVYVVRY